MLYKIIRLIGKGATSCVYEARYEGRPVAIKRILRKNRSVADNEITFLRFLSHPYIVRLLDAIHRENDTLLIFDLHESSSLLYHEHLAESTVLKIVRMLLQAIEYMHRSNVMHRDIKLSNVLLTKTDVKICDFGLAAFKGEHVTYCGTQQYMAPEVGSTYDELVDVYGVGRLMYRLLKGMSMDTDEQIDVDTLDASYLAKDLLMQLMSSKRDRPAADSALKHPVFNCFYPSMVNYDVLPDFVKSTRVGEIKKEGQSLSLLNYGIRNSIFFKDGNPTSKHLILHRDLRFFRYMLAIADIYVKRYGRARQSTHHGPELTSTRIWPSTSYVLPQLKYFYCGSHWLVFNTLQYSLVFLLDGTRVECNSEQITVHGSGLSHCYVFADVLSDRCTVGMDVVRTFRTVLSMLTEMRQAYK